ncbi:MAG: cytochrome P450 [Sphingomonadales bacterium]
MPDTDDARRLYADFHIEDPLLSERFEDTLDDLLAACPVARSRDGAGYYVVNRHEDVRRCARDWRTFSSADGWMLNPPEGSIPILPEDSDPPYHNTWRHVLNPFFSRENVAGLEEFARACARGLIEAIAPKGGCEFIADYAAILPGRILFERILPVPVADLPVLFEDIDLSSFGPPAGRGPAFGRVHAYLEDFLRRRSEMPPKGDLVDLIVAGVDKDGTPCPWQDKVYIILDVVFGGLATTTHVMSGAIHHLATHPETRRALLADPSLIDAVVEETIRLYPPVVAAARTVRAETEVAGVALKPGDRVALNFAAAGRDPEACANPSQFDPRRGQIVHTTFGVGPHRCLGEHLARLEIKVTVEEFLRRIPEFGLVPGTAPVYESGQLRTMKNLHLAWNAAE